MLARIAALTERPLSFIRSFKYRRTDSIPNSSRGEMDFTDLDSNATKCVNLRLCSVSGCMTEILEIRADRPSFHVVFVPGNPGVITFYKDFVESLFKSLGGTASVSAVGASGHTEKNWEHGKLYSLQEQIDHKIEFIKVQNIEAPLVLVGHSIGSYIALEMLRRLPEKLSETPDWEFMRENQEKISFLYGIDDHWGPLQMFEEVSRQASGIALSIEREGHTHGFCCTEAGSIWVARHVASLIKNKLAR